MHEGKVGSQMFTKNWNFKSVFCKEYLKLFKAIGPFTVHSFYDLLT